MVEQIAQPPARADSPSPGVAAKKSERSADDATKRDATAIVDGDIHNALPSHETLCRFLPERWRDYHLSLGRRSYSGAYYPRANLNAARTDSWPPSGLPPGADLDFLRQQLLDAWNVGVGVLNPLIRVGGLINLEYGAEMARAVNDWQLAEWIEPEPRLRASMVVPYEDGDLAALEIDRLGENPGFIQILVLARTAEPLGRRKYWRMYEAAVRHDLPIGIHFGGEAGNPISAVGWPSFYVEDHGGMPVAFQAQVTSLVLEGVFERFPTLKVVLIEGGFAWLASLMWRLDNAWNRLKLEVPHLKRPPSEYIREHIWLTTQPMEEPSESKHFAQLLRHLDMDDRLMFATDYPHWDFDAPNRALPPNLAPRTRERVMRENALALYHL